MGGSRRYAAAGKPGEDSPAQPGIERKAFRGVPNEARHVRVCRSEKNVAFVGDDGRRNGQRDTAGRTDKGRPEVPQRDRAGGLVPSARKRLRGPRSRAGGRQAVRHESKRDRPANRRGQGARRVRAQLATRRTRRRPCVPPCDSSGPDRVARLRRRRHSARAVPCIIARGSTNTPCSIRPSSSNTAFAPMSVSSRRRGISPPSARLGLSTQARAFSSEPSTCFACANTRVRRTSRSDSTGESFCSCARRATRDGALRKPERRGHHDRADLQVLGYTLERREGQTVSNERHKLDLRRHPLDSKHRQRFLEKRVRLVDRLVFSRRRATWHRCRRQTPRPRSGPRPKKATARDGRPTRPRACL